jgi:hypothetical protein
MEAALELALNAADPAESVAFKPVVKIVVEPMVEVTKVLPSEIVETRAEVVIAEDPPTTP